MRETCVTKLKDIYMQTFTQKYKVLQVQWKRQDCLCSFTYMSTEDKGLKPQEDIMDS